ncbi:MAG: rRNA maturation RNase YbeY [Robiginitomaculum sp.]|nr:MAG: rRNA maturation RNase YbeY [Robiginitomaculum sp.]
MSEPHREYEIDIVIEDKNWPAREILQSLAARAIDAALQHIEGRSFAELSLAFLDDARVQALNREYRGQDKPTNVLSFPAGDHGGDVLLGDIVLGYETVAREAETRKIALTDHISHLLIHGFYHLQGYDHETDVEAEAMEALERLALCDLGIDDPYAMDEIL